MSELQYDFVVLGGGSAGYGAATLAVAQGLAVAVIEGGEEVGGLCILRGCMPSKTFLESGHRAEAIRHAAEFGLRAEYHGADGLAIQERKRRLIAEFASYRQQQLEQGKFAFHRGTARFTSPQTVSVALRGGGTQEVRGRSFLIATGSRIKVFEVPGLKETGFLNSDQVLEAREVPKSVIILGAGPTGLEFASYYAGLGAEVTVVQRGQQLLKGVDADVADALAEALRKRGVRIFAGTKLSRAERAGGLKRVHFEMAGQPQTAEGEEIIYALGREPNTAALDLARAGVPVQKWGGVHASCTQQTEQPHIFAAGDVCGPYEVVHLAIQQAEVAARNAARLLRGEGEKLEDMDYSLKLFAVFTQPEVASVGLTTCEANELGYRFMEAHYPFADHGKAIVHGETEGFVKLLAAGPERKIIGGAVVGPHASELIHEIVVAMRFGATAAQLAAVPHYHPTLSEIWTYPAEALAGAECE